MEASEEERSANTNMLREVQRALAERELQLARVTSVLDKRLSLANESADGDGGGENGIRYAQRPIRKHS